MQALVVPDGFQHILRVLNTNIDGKEKIMYGLTSIKVELIERMCLRRLESCLRAFRVLDAGMPIWCARKQRST